ncbi:MAG: tetratricopeptide repeat protein [Archangium sp.]|nr:tetratricopeptide repeat protein [Archangium sp.]MDP3158152.1 tetratricopeptide repeat protein [Archangium sp.]MDP3571705.1 tetratricopeptide repeat protein [Archangium sp.]
MAETTADAAKLLEEIRREVVESRNMTIKTDNALKTLHAELKLVSTQQDAFQSRTWFSTGAAYVVFAALCVAGVVVISNTRAAGANAERERLEKQVGELTSTIDKLKADATGQLAAEQSALQVYRQMTTLPGEERLKGIDALQKIDQTRLTAFAKLVLQDRAVALRKEVGGAVLEKGKTAFRRQDWPETISQLGRFLSMDPVEEDALEASFYLGNAYFQSRKFEDAIKHLTRFADGDKKAKLRDFAMLMLMQCYDMTGAREQAIATAKEAYNSYPSSDFRNQFVARLQRTVPQPAAAPAPAAPAPVAPGPGPR